MSNWIRECTSTHGKVKVVLRQGRFFIESTNPSVLQHLLTDDVIAAARIDADAEAAAAAATTAAAAATAAAATATPATGDVRRDAASGFLVADKPHEVDSIGAALRNDALEEPAPRSLLEVLDEQVRACGVFVCLF